MIRSTIFEYREDCEISFGAAGCFCVCSGELLMIQRQRGKSFEYHWGIPTGKIEAGETAREAAARELFEEVGLAVEPFKLIPLNELIVFLDSEAFRFTSFVVLLHQKPDLNIKIDEIRQIEWVHSNRLLKRRVVPCFWNTLDDLSTWLSGGLLQPRLFPVPERSSSGGKMSNVRFF